jgi:hypothetical protein
MHPILIGCGAVPRSLVIQRVKVPPAPFTRIGAEANSGRVSLARGNLKSLRRSSARSKSEPEVGYANNDPPATWGSSMPPWGWTYRMQTRTPQTGCYHRGLACLIRVGMKTNGWLGDRGRSRIVLDRGKEGITTRTGKPE